MKQRKNIHISMFIVDFINSFFSRKVRYFDVFSDKYDNESHSNHPNIRYKGENDEVKDIELMVKYVLKEDEEPLSNFDFHKELKELEEKGLEKNNKKDKNYRSKDVIPLFQWVNETFNIILLFF